MFSELLRVLSLPTRNGNDVLFEASPGSHTRSEPTYEEWKHSRSGRLTPWPHRSEPTYEEWKRSITDSIVAAR